MITVILGTLFFFTMPLIALGAFAGWYLAGGVGCVIGMVFGAVLTTAASQ